MSKSLNNWKVTIICDNSYKTEFPYEKKRHYLDCVYSLLTTTKIDFIDVELVISPNELFSHDVGKNWWPGI